MKNKKIHLGRAFQLETEGGWLAKSDGCYVYFYVSMQHTATRNIKNQNHAQPSTAGVAEMMAATNHNADI